MKIRNRSSCAGITLIEAVFAIGIFSLVMTALTALFVYGLRWNSTIWDQLSAQSDGKRAMEQMVHDIRKAEPSSIGGYPIERAAANEFIFFANVDGDSLRERVRYTLTGTTLKRGITEPSGQPLRYNTSTEAVADVARDVQNIGVNVPVFTYYGEGYTGSEAALIQPVTVSDVRAVRVQIELERDAAQSPVPFHVESFVTIRNQL